MSEPSIRVGAFESADENPLLHHARNGVDQATYLVSLLHDLGARSVLVESRYFDWNYLAEYAAFEAWGTRAREIGNECQRVHFFRDTIDDARWAAARRTGGDSGAGLLGDYIGFTVLRPLPWARLGRTVISRNGSVREHETGRGARVDRASRRYTCHVNGVTLHVTGLAWQQQDGNVARCATVAIWSALHAAPLDETHGLPTTADITRWAHDRTSGGGRVFPSAGLSVFQVCDAMNRAGYAAECLQGDVSGAPLAFSRERFGPLCATALRSGFPVIISASIDLKGGGTDRHAVCAVSYREPPPQVLPSAEPVFVDASIPFIYVHDDNLGPGVRYALDEQQGSVRLIRSPPPDAPGSSFPRYDPEDRRELRPDFLVVAMHPHLRMGLELLHRHANKLGQWLVMASERSRPAIGVSARYCRMDRYLEHGLVPPLHAGGDVAGEARRQLADLPRAMSLFVGVVRLSGGGWPLMDVLLDTTDTSPQLHPLGHVVFHPEGDRLAAKLLRHGKIFDLGPAVRAWPGAQHP